MIKICEPTTASPQAATPGIADHSAVVLIPAGEFLMGAEDGSPAEQPVHKVHLDAFYIDAHLVTNAQFAAFVNATGYRTTAEEDSGEQRFVEGTPFPPGLTWKDFNTEGRQDHPVVLVSWFDAGAYAEWAGKRLPTEAEWEKAALGGADGKRFPWGDEPAEESHANWNRARPDITVPPTSSVKAYPPNGYGLFDMAGNVWQWCVDWYADDFYSVSPNQNPQGPEAGLYRVRRGGSWNVGEVFRLRCANRGAMTPNLYWPNMGFRCARSGSPGEES
jgi:formylglycine-generating enzyme required for sulfatase activity